MNVNNPDYDIYVDGAYRASRGKGAGVGWVIVDASGEVVSEKFLSVAAQDSTTVEILAAMHGLLNLPENSYATLFTDCFAIIDWWNSVGRIATHLMSHFDLLKSAVDRHEKIIFAYMPKDANNRWHSKAHDLANQALPALKSQRPRRYPQGHLFRPIR